jgi:membrane-associated phospholipid phosphatase
MGHTDWLPTVATPAHPEYPSTHSALSAATAYAMEKFFGGVRSFTDHTYDYLGYSPRIYSSFPAVANEAGISRLYGGIHYQPSIDVGLAQGKKVADNIFDQHHSFGF